MMKAYRPLAVVFVLLIAVTGFAFTTGAREHSGRGGSARLFIKRSPDLGNLAYVAVRMDGREIGSVLWAQNFDAIIPSGRHVIEVQLEPAEHSYSPSTMTLDVHPGRTYAFMAMKKGGALVLGRL